MLERVGEMLCKQVCSALLHRHTDLDVKDKKHQEVNIKQERKVLLGFEGRLWLLLRSLSHHCAHLSQLSDFKSSGIFNLLLVFTSGIPVPSVRW